MEQSISFRPIREDDLEFLFQVYAGTREEELKLTSWSDQQKEQFLRGQFHAQHQYYQQQFSQASFDVILRDGRAIGRLYVDRREDELRVVDIALLPQHRGAGIGGKIMRDLLQEAGAAAKPVRIHVEQNNPAQRLYHRLGFTKVGETGIYHLMECTPKDSA